MTSANLRDRAQHPRGTTTSGRRLVATEPAKWGREAWPESQHRFPMKSTSLYSEEQIRAAEQYLKEVGADDMDLDNRSGRSGRPETLRALKPDERGIRILEGVYLDFFAKDRLALIVPRYTQQLPLTWIKAGARLVVMRRFADENLGIRQIIEGLVTSATEARRDDDPSQAIVLVMQISRQRQFEPGEDPG